MTKQSVFMPFNNGAHWFGALIGARKKKLYKGMIVYILDPLKKGRTQRLNLYGGFTLQLFLKLVQEIYETGENRNLYMNYIRQQMGCDKAYIHAAS